MTWRSDLPEGHGLRVLCALSVATLRDHLNAGRPVKGSVITPIDADW